MKTVLIPTDFSKISENAIQQGLSLLQQIGMEGKVLLLNTYLLPSSSPHELVSIHDKLKKKSMGKLEEELNQVKKNLASNKISFETLSYIGSLENVVTHLANERKIDYLILGIDGELKSEIAKVLTRIHCPALIVPFKQSSSEKLPD